MRLLTIFALWQASIAGLFALACYLSFYRKGEVEQPDSSMLAWMKQGDRKSAAKQGFIVLVFLISLLAVLVVVATSAPWFMKSWNRFAVFTTFYVLPMFIIRRNALGTWGRIATIVGMIGFASLSTHVWLTYRNWITMDIVVFAMALMMLLGFRNITYQQCVVVSAAIMVFDAISVFGTKHMVVYAESAATNNGIMLNVPMGFSPDAAQAFSLGLGDIVSPGLIVLLACRLYKARGAAGAIAGYVVGMVVTLVVLIVFQFPQPATIYLLPATFAGFLLSTGDWKRLARSSA